MFNDLINGVYGKFSGHTHPRGYSMEPGPRDSWFLRKMHQERSSVWRYDGDGWLPFGQEPWLTNEIRENIRREQWQKMYQ